MYNYVAYHKINLVENLLCFSPWQLSSTIAVVDLIAKLCDMYVILGGREQ